MHACVCTHRHRTATVGPFLVYCQELHDAGDHMERIADTLEELVGMGDLAQEIRSKYNAIKPRTVTGEGDEQNG